MNEYRLMRVNLSQPVKHSPALPVEAHKEVNEGAWVVQSIEDLFLSQVSILM